MSDYYTLVPVDVRRVTHQGGSHAEPPLDPNASEIAKLEWKLGEIQAESGVQVRVTAFIRDGQWRYCLNVGRTGMSDRHFGATWDALNYISVGYLAGGGGVMSGQAMWT